MLHTRLTRRPELYQEVHKEVASQPMQRHLPRLLLDWIGVCPAISPLCWTYGPWRGKRRPFMICAAAGDPFRLAVCTLLSGSCAASLSWEHCPVWPHSM